MAVDAAPASAIVGQKLIRFAGSWASRRIDWKICLALLGPGVEHRLYDTPSVLHHIGAHEQRRIADHDVIEQGLVSDVRLLGEPVVVAELHLHRGEVHHWAGTLDLKLQGN